MMILIWMARQGDSWNDLLKEIVTISSVEEFWGVHVSLPEPSLYSSG